MKLTRAPLIIFAIVQCSLANGQSAAKCKLNPDSTEQLILPPVFRGEPEAGKRVLLTPPEYAGTKVYHSVYLPEAWTPDWKKTGQRIPIVFEYTGNKYLRVGSTGKVKDAGLGYGLSGGKTIWVSLPYISADGKHNEVTWWGDEKKTIQYAKTNVPRIIKQFGGDPRCVFLCGFSRGAIAVNYIGLHDDQIASLWTAFVTHDHFDGVREWKGTAWGAPLETYRRGAAERLKRVGSRPYLVCQNGKIQDSEMFVRSVLSSVENFTFTATNTRAIFGKFPNTTTKGAHTDRWLLKPSPYRSAAWKWMNRVTQNRQ